MKIFFFSGAIEKKIEESGFIVAAKKQLKLTAELVKGIYKDAANKPYFNDLVNLMTKYGHHYH
jgi:nucleoside diphosphate kinase